MKKLISSFFVLAVVIFFVAVGYQLVGRSKIESAEGISELIAADSLCKLANTPLDPVLVRRALGDSRSEIESLFIDAVSKAGLFTDEDRANYDAAIDEFRKLQSLDPDNGAYSMFVAYLMSKLGADRNSIRNELLFGFHSKKVSIPTDVGDLQLYEKSFSNPSQKFLYVRYVESGQRLQYAKLSTLFHRFISQENVDFNKAAVEFATRLFPANVKADQFPDVYHWEHLRYSLALRILNSAWKKAYPNLEPPNYLIRRNFVIAEVSRHSSQNQPLNKLTKSVDNFYTCDRQAFDTWFTEQRIVFSNREN